jgi:hypothetical protein
MSPRASRRAWKRIQSTSHAISARITDCVRKLGLVWCHGTQAAAAADSPARRDTERVACRGTQAFPPAADKRQPRVARTHANSLYVGGPLHPPQACRSSRRSSDGRGGARSESSTAPTRPPAASPHKACRGRGRGRHGRRLPNAAALEGGGRVEREERGLKVGEAGFRMDGRRIMATSDRSCRGRVEREARKSGKEKGWNEEVRVEIKR